MGAFSCGQYLHGKLGVTDSSADQGRVENQRLHKTVSGSPHNLVLFRLRYASGRIGAAVKGETVVIPVNKDTGNSCKQLEDNILLLVCQPHFPVRDILFGKIPGILRHGLRLHRFPDLHDL